jgi:hypothetical protein
MHEALCLGDRLPETILNPNQIRANGLQVEDVPKQFDSRSSHAIHTKKRDVHISLSLDGVISGFESRKPTWEEYEEHPRLELTSNVKWKPSSKAFAKEERRHVSLTKRLATISEATPDDHFRQAAAARAYHSSQHAVEFDDDLFGSLIDTVHAAPDDLNGDGLQGHLDNDIYPKTNQHRRLFSLSTGEQWSVLTPEVLAQRWNIGLAAAKRTMQSTTQSGIRNVLAPGERKVRQRLDHLKCPTLKGMFWSDTSFASVKSLRGHSTAQHFTNGLGYERFYPMKSKSKAPAALMSSAQDAGIPPTLVTDNAHEETHGEWGQTCRVCHIQQKHTTPCSPWQNLAEASGVGAVKQGIRRATSRKRSPKRLWWCYCGQWVAAIIRLTALDLPQLDGQTPESHVLGSTVDMSAYAQFDWYEYVWYLEPKASFPNEKKCLGRWLGIAEVSIDVMASSYILTDKGTVVVRKSIWGLSKLEFETDEVKQTAKELDEQITRKLDNSLPVERDSKDDPADPCTPLPPEDLWDDLDDVEEVADPFDPESTKPDADELQ